MNSETTERLSVIGVGDAILLRELSMIGTPGFRRLRELIQSADCSFANLEFVTPRLPATPTAYPIAIRLASPPGMIDELNWMGFNLFSLANNHSDDYGTSGLLDTCEQLELRGQTFAGGGRDLVSARMPSYRETANGRVAVIGVTSSGARGALAANGAGPVAPRPGINPLRFETEYLLDPGLFDELCRIDEALGTAASTRFLAGLGIFPEAPDEMSAGRLFLGSQFRRGDESRVLTRTYGPDKEDICRWISEAARQSDCVVVSVHGHESKNAGWNMDDPADFLPEAAHAFIEAGADIVFGHGPHRLRGMEVYRGKPILYSLGNFFFMDEMVDVVGQEQYQLLSMPLNSTPADLHDFRELGDGGSSNGFHSDSAFWESIVAKCSVSSKGIDVELFPVDIVRTGRRAGRGTPCLVEGERGRAILERFAHLSMTQFGTQVIVSQDGSSGSVVADWSDRACEAGA